MPARVAPRPAVAAAALALLLGAPAAPAHGDTPATSAPVRFAGRPLVAALQELAAGGLQVVFASSVVRPEMRVLVEPRATTPRAILDELLAPHGLLARDGPRGTVVVVQKAAMTVETTGHAGSVPAPAAGAAAPPAATFDYELVVTPSRVPLLRAETGGGLALGRDDIDALPHLGNDFFRALTLLPGTAGNDVSAAFHVRGGRRDETLVLLDGQEIYDTFHLADYDDALSVVAPQALGGSELLTGGYATRYGDRMSGVLDLRTREAEGRRRGRLDLGVLSASLGGDGTFADGRARWLAEVRRGSLDLVGRRLGTEDPSYWDAFAKIDLTLGERHTLAGHALVAEDALDFAETEGEFDKRFRTRYANAQLWLAESSLLGTGLLVETAGGVARLDRDRRGVEHEEVSDSAVLDRRDTAILELRQGWSWRAGERHELEGGWQLRDFDSDYDYTGLHRFESPIATLRHDAPSDATLFRGGFRQRHAGLFVLDRTKLTPGVTIEVGARYDLFTEDREQLLSPRLQLAWRIGERSVLRAAWGRFGQSQRTYEAAVEDGETRLHPVERAEHQILGWERLLGPAAAPSDLVLRLELWRRPVENPRPRYEDLFEPINTFPEVEPTRVKIAPEESLAQGFEAFLIGRLGATGRWWVDYTWSRTEDRIDGRWAPRSFDQTHAVNLDLDFALGRHWRLNAAWRYHTGWPTTTIAVHAVEDDEDGEEEEDDERRTARFEPVLGPRNGARLPDYHRLDLRLHRAWSWARGEVRLYFDVQNAFDRRNVAGYDLQIDEEEGNLDRTVEHWPGVLASVGVVIDF